MNKLFAIDKYMIAKLKAFLLHFLLSGMVILCFAGLIWFVWYPNPFLKAEGGLEIVGLLIGVDLILGPTLTAMVYKKGKKGLIFDLSLIILLQFGALAYGMNALYQERPQYVAFEVDRFVLVPAASINTDELKDKTLLTGVFDKPRVVYIELEEDAKKRADILLETIYGGKGYAERPEYYHEISHYVDTLGKGDRQLELARIVELYPEFELAIKKLAVRHNAKPEQFVFYPLRGKQRNMILVLKREDLTVIGGLDIDPWFVESGNTDINKQQKPASQE